MFVKKDKSKAVKFFERLNTARWRRGEYLQMLLDIYNLQRNSDIKIRDTMEIITRSMPSIEKEKIVSLRTWKGSIECVTRMGENSHRDLRLGFDDRSFKNKISEQLDYMRKFIVIQIFRMLRSRLNTSSVKAIIIQISVHKRKNIIVRKL